MSELDIISMIQSKYQDHHLIALGPTDDCAVIDSHPQKSLVTTDTLMDGAHFLLAQASPEQIAHKALGVNLSDIAAMGGMPEYALLSLCLPKDLTNGFCERFYEKAFAMAKSYNFAIAGGDTNSWNGPLVISVTLFGRPHFRGPVTRQGATPGDWIFVTGPLGGSLDGHHLDFTPRLELARQLLDQGPINSMIDLSDGIATDLRHILKRSGVGARLYRERLPARPNISHLSGDEQIKRMLSDGEDFELCLTMEPQLGEALSTDPLFSNLFHVGIITKERKLVWDDTEDEIVAKGYEHMLDSKPQS